jgi:organic hydroperoxide reductase OsmC/OhrA
MMATLKSQPTGGAPTDKTLDLAESVAGEEDPGAAIDLPMDAAASGRSDLPARRPVHSPAQARSMSHYTAQILWQRGVHEFLGNRYSRRHLIRFDGGAEVTGSSSPHVVPVPQSDPAGVDPEETFVASLSSCHMLWFLSLAASGGFCVDSYADTAQGVMSRNAAGKMAMTQVTLRPAALFSGAKQPTRHEIDELHHRAHEKCFIANSVTTEMRCEPVYPDA